MPGVELVNKGFAIFNEWILPFVSSFIGGPIASVQVLYQVNTILNHPIIQFFKSNSQLVHHMTAIIYQYIYFWNLGFQFTQELPVILGSYEHPGLIILKPATRGINIYPMIWHSSQNIFARFQVNLPCECRFPATLFFCPWIFENACHRSQNNGAIYVWGCRYAHWIFFKLRLVHLKWFSGMNLIFLILSIPQRFNKVFVVGPTQNWPTSLKQKMFNWRS